jgi:hypothetical protein
MVVIASLGVACTVPNPRFRPAGAQPQDASRPTDRVTIDQADAADERRPDLRDTPPPPDSRPPGDSASPAEAQPLDADAPDTAAMPTAQAWRAGASYLLGDDVSYLQLEYRCRQAHVANLGWEPPNTYALWERINAGALWAVQVVYKPDELTQFQGLLYRALQMHQAETGLEPPNAPSLWTVVK